MTIGSFVEKREVLKYPARINWEMDVVLTGCDARRWSKEFVGHALRLRNGIRLQADAPSWPAAVPALQGETNAGARPSEPQTDRVDLGESLSLLQRAMKQYSA